MDLVDERPEESHRSIRLSEGEIVEAPPVSNFVHASKYTVFTFVPLAIADQLLRLSSAWFIIAIVCEANPIYSDTAASSIAAGLFLLHLAINLACAAVAMWHSRAEVASINSSMQQVWRDGAFRSIPCQQIKVGDCVLITHQVLVPADSILLATSGANGTCHISTIRTLGESSLEMKSAVRETHRMLVSEHSPAQFNFDRLQATVKVERPNHDFLSFSGSIKLRRFPRAIALKTENFVLKGSLLQGEKWALALVVYAGMETKYWSNLLHPRRRPTFIEKLVNRWIVYSAVSVCIGSGLLTLLQFALSEIGPTVEDFAFYMRLYIDLVPLYLFLALDILRLVLAAASSDSDVAVHSDCLVEDLGKVGFVLADKTGTVTQGKLELLAVLIGTQLYAKPETFLQAEEHLETVTPCSAIDKHYSFEDLKQQMRLGEASERLQRFCECVALCNSVIPMPDESFLGTSIDEEALMAGATELGFTLCDRTPDAITILIFEECVPYEIIAMKKFSTDVKRMRILVKQEVNPTVATLFIKGSYKALHGMLSLTRAERTQLEQQLDVLSARGLRIMVLCYRQIEGDYLREIEERIMTIKSSRNSQNVEGNLEVLLMELEQNLTYLGATGVRDHLHPGAVEAIQSLHAAGIVTWLLSGEGESNTLACARELAIVPRECPLLSLCCLRKTEDCLVRFSKAANQLLSRESSQTEASVLPALSESMRTERILPHDFVLSLDGVTLKTALKNEETQRLLLYILVSASAVCLNTMHPNHKREAVQLLRLVANSNAAILAIGDGVNDVPMLLEADVRVGIRNEESEAICDVTSNYFTELPKLLLKQGRRNATLLLRTTVLFIYSQVLVVLGDVVMPMYAGFMPASLVPSDALSLYKGAIAFVPIVILSVFSCSEMDKISPPAHNCVTLGRSLLLASTQSAIVHGLLFASSLSRTATSISSDELSFLYLITVTAVVSVTCVSLAPRRRGWLALIQILGFGGLMTYYAANEEGAATITEVCRTPRLLLGAIGAVLASVVVFLAGITMCSLRDVQQYNSNKIMPLDIPEADLSSIRKASKNLLRAYSSHGVDTYEQLDRFAVSRRSATFLSAAAEKRFQEAFLRANRKLYWVQLGIVILQALAQLLGRVAPGTTTPLETSVISTAFSTLCLLSILFAVSSIVQYAAQVFALGLTIVTFALNVVTSGNNSHLFFYVTVCTLLFLREKWLPNFVISLLATAMLICSLALGAEELEWSTAVALVGTAVAQTFTLTLAGKVSYQKALVIRDQFKLIEESKLKIEQSETILGYLLPDFVCNLVKDGLSYTAEDQGEVSILFIDICLFDHICASYPPAELITLLDEVFQRIDELCSSLRVAKIETVGKTYLACAGLRDFEFAETGEDSSIPHAKRALDLAFAVLRNFKNTRLMHGHYLSFKIGINTGPVIAGVVGHHKPQFVLVGDTVNTASRMASTIEDDDTVQISESTYLQVNNRPEYQFHPRELQVKGKGQMLTYMVNHVAKHFSNAPESPIRFSTQRTMRGKSTTVKENVAVLQARDISDKDRWFSCELSQQERFFRLQTQKRLSGRVKLGLIQFAIGMFCLFLARVRMTDFSAEEVVPTVVYILLSALSSCFLLFYRHLIERPVFPWVLATVYFLASLVVGLDSRKWEALSGYFDALIEGFLLVLVNFASGLLFRPSALATVAIIAPHMWSNDSADGLQHECFFLLFALQCCLLQFATERSQRAFFRTSELAKKEIKKTEQLLTHMIPVHAYEGLRQGQWSTDRLYNVSILFADISGFTSWSSAHSPAKVIDKLSTIFTAFDKICVQRSLYKVCTIGDCYVALSSTSNADGRNPGEECQKMVAFAFEMAQVIEDICMKDGEQLKMRIGVHVGEVIGGITGSRIVRYDIYGPDVVVANKMESTGAVGKVNVSKEAKAMLKKTDKDAYHFEYNKKVDIPEIERSAEGYFVSLRKDG